MEDNIASPVTDETLFEQAHFEYATKGQRFVNYIVDLVLYYYTLYKLLSFPGGILSTADGKFDSKAAASHQFMIVVYAILLLPVLYAFTEGVTKGRSPGKLLTGTVAVRADLSKITWGDAIMRSLLRMVPIDPISGFFGPPIHDKFSKTMVIKNRAVF